MSVSIQQEIERLKRLLTPESYAQAKPLWDGLSQEIEQEHKDQYYKDCKND